MRTALIACLVAGASMASAAVMNFDTFAEGTFGTTMTQNGITLSSLDQNFGTGPNDNFVIEDASGNLTGLPGYTSPNVLTFGGYSPGPGASFGRFGSMNFTMGVQASSASLDLFAFANDAGGTLTLQGLLNGNVANSVTVSVPSSFTITRTEVVLGSGVYDSFRIVASSPTNENSIFVSMDNITVNPVPEPASIAVLSLGVAYIIRRRKRG